MNDEQHYLLDSIGLTIHRNGLSKDQVAEMNGLIEGALGGRAAEKFPILEIGPSFLDLMTQPWVMAACVRTIGDRFRFDHAFGLQQPTARPNLHGGPQACQASCFYHGGPSPSGAAWMGRLSVGFALTGQSKSTGGFAYIPGSHKSNSTMHGSQVLASLLKGDFEHEALHVPTLNPGDICLFPDCLVHGTTPWNGSQIRRVLYYMYSPGYMAWRPYSEIEKYLPLARTQLQRHLLRPPYVASFTESPTALGDNRWREPTQ